GAEIGTRDLFVGEVGHDGAEIVDAIVDAADGAGGESRIAAAFFLGRALQHRHVRALLARREGGAEGGVAGADDDDRPGGAAGLAGRTSVHGAVAGSILIISRARA